MTAYDLKNIASAGGNIVVSAKDFSAYDLKNIAENRSSNKGKANHQKRRWIIWI